LVPAPATVCLRAPLETGHFDSFVIVLSFDV
jgi:hypothetical protein